MPGSPAVPGIPRAPCGERERERGRDEESGLLSFQVILGPTGEEQSLTEVPASPRSPGRPALPGSPCSRRKEKPGQTRAGQTTSVFPFIQSVFAHSSRRPSTGFLHHLRSFRGGQQDREDPWDPRKSKRPFSADGGVCQWVNTTASGAESQGSTQMFPEVHKDGPIDVVKIHENQRDCRKKQTKRFQKNTHRGSGLTGLSSGASESLRTLIDNEKRHK